MIIKLLSEHSPARPAMTDSLALERWKRSVLLEIEKKVSPKALSKITEKFLVPQKWRATVSPVVKAANIAAEDEVMIEGVANASDPDRGRELILNSAWKTENFDLNPIILFNHNHNWPIGSCVEYKVEDNGLYYRASIGNPSAYPRLTETQEMCRSLLAQGILRASSVGFLPYNIDYDEENDILRYTEVELLEISLVSVPMQQGSLLDSVGPAAKSMNSSDAIKEGKKGMDKAQFDEIMGLLGKIMAACEAKKEPSKEPPMNEEACGEEEKKLKGKIELLEKELKTVKEEKEVIEKQAQELISGLEKTGLKIS